MPVIDSMATEVTKQCIEVISEQIVNRIINYLGFSNLFLFNDNLFISSDDLQSSNFDDSSDNIRSQNNRCDVKIVPGYSPFETKFDIVSGRGLDSAIQMKRWNIGEYPVFSDKRSSVYVVEVGLPSMIELQFEVKLKSIELSDTFHNALFSRALTNGGMTDYNDIQFSYGLSDKLILFLYKIFKMQDDLLNEMTFKDYLTIGSNSAITPMTNRFKPDQDIELVIQRTNSKVIGRLEYSGDKHETEYYNKVSNRYVISFSYFIQYTKPVLLRTAYPIMIYNKIIDKQYIGKNIQNMSDGESKQYFQEVALNNYFLRQNDSSIKLEDSYPLVRYPFFDDWQRSPAMYSNINTKYQLLFIGLLSVDINPDDSSLSLSVDLENEVFPMLNQKAVDEIKYVINNFELDENAFSTKDDIYRRLGIFDIALFCNDSLVVYDKLSLSSEYLLSVTGDLDLSKQYRLVISQIKDISILNRQYVYYMLSHPDYYTDFLAAHMDFLVTNGYVKIITDLFTKQVTAVPELRMVQDDPWVLTPNRAITINNYIVEVRRQR
jgi:hypothetical protein